MSAKKSKSFAGGDLGGAFNPAGPMLDYVIDLSQRTILFWDVMRQRGNGYREHLAKTAPHVLRTRQQRPSCSFRHATARRSTMAIDLNDYPLWSIFLTRIVKHTTLFCTSGELTRGDVPSGGIGVKQLVMQRV